MIEAAAATGIAWYWWALGVYVFGLAVVAFIAGWADCEGDEIVPIAIFWPLITAFVIIASPFAALWFLGNMLRLRA